jgi:hypothetical protein
VRTEDLNQKWFHAGWGQTADQAIAASRYSRSSEVRAGAQDFADPKLQSALAASLKEAQLTARVLAKELSPGGGPMDSGYFDLVRKYKDNVELETAIKDHFGFTSVPEGVGARLRTYVSKVDEFSPGLYIPERRLASFTDAQHGGISVDFVGMGAKNLDATARALLGAKNLDEALSNARAAERVVTRQFDFQRSRVMDTMGQTGGRAVKVEAICSGDDCVGIPSAPLSDTDKSRFVRNLATQGSPSSYRVAFVNNKVLDAESRGLLVTHGESLEKIMRQNLSGRLEPQRIEGILIGADMQGGRPGEGNIRVLIGRTPALKISNEERRILDQTLRRSIEQLNSDLRTLGVSSGYSARGVEVLD